MTKRILSYAAFLLLAVATSYVTATITRPAYTSAQSGMSGGVTGFGIAGRCAQWATTNSLTAAAGACGGGGGGITGSGTATHIPQFTSSTAVGDTPVTYADAGIFPAFTITSSETGDTNTLNLGVDLSSNAPGISVEDTTLGNGCAVSVGDGFYCGPFPFGAPGPFGILSNDAMVLSSDGTNIFPFIASGNSMQLGSAGIETDRAGDLFLATLTANTPSPFLQFESQSAGPTEALFELFGDTGGSLNSMACKGAACTPITTGFLVTTTGGVQGSTYATATNCANGAAPAVCGSAASGAVAVPTGTNPTLTVNTSAVSAASRIFLTIDESLTISGVTCNTTLATLLQPVVTARVVNTSFTIQVPATLAVNPACVSYFIEN